MCAMEMETSGGQQNHRVKRVALPSGKTIEVVYFDDQSAAQATAPCTTEELHLCPDCDAALVYPTQWSEVDRMRWEVTLRCPNCEWNATDVFEEDDVQRFDETLDRGTEALVGDLRQLSRANMEHDVERFILALNGGHLLPEDF